MEEINLILNIILLIGIILLFNYVQKYKIVETHYVKETINNEVKEKEEIKTHGNTGKICINKNGELKKIQHDELPQYLHDGWEKGTGIRLREKNKNIQEEYKNDIRKMKSEIQKGRKCINKDGVTKRVKENEVEEYIKLGWKLGIGYDNSNPTKDPMKKDRLTKYEVIYEDKIYYFNRIIDISEYFDLPVSYLYKLSSGKCNMNNKNMIINKL